MIQSVEIDYLSKMANFISCAKAFDAYNMTKLFFKVIHLHEPPPFTVFNRGVKFVGQF